MIPLKFGAWLLLNTREISPCSSRGWMILKWLGRAIEGRRFLVGRCCWRYTSFMAVTDRYKIESTKCGIGSNDM